LKEVLNMRNKINYKKIAFYSIFIFLIILGRVIFLDSDLPANIDLLNLYPFDEGFYTQSAFNLYNYGTFTHNIVPYITNDAGVANLFQTILTYMSLLIFGNNYYGVRMPSIFISLITIWLFYLTLKNIKEDNSKFTNYSIFSMVLYFVTDFEYLSISRIYVPTVFRIFFITLMIYIFSKYYKESYKEIFTHKHIFIFSFLSMSSIFFIYIYNIFIYSAIVFTIFTVSLFNNWKKNKKQIAKDSFFIILGTLFSLILFIIYLKVIYSINIIDYFEITLRTGQAKQILKNTNFYSLILLPFKTIYDTLSTNIFRFNIILLLIFLLSLPIFTKKIIKNKNIFNIFLLNILFFKYTQSLFENTFFYKRLTVLLPVILIIIFLTKNHLFQDEFKINYKYLLYVILSFVLTISVLYFRVINDYKFGGLKTALRHGYDGNLKLSFVIFSTIILFSFIFLHIKSLKNKKYIKYIFITLVISNLFLISNYTYNFPTYYSKNTMIKLKKINGKKITGKVAFGYRFYNNSIPILNVYKYMDNPEKYNEYGKLLYRLVDEEIVKYALQPAYNDGRLNLVNKKNSNFKIGLDKVYYSGNGIYLKLLNLKIDK